MKTNIIQDNIQPLPSFYGGTKFKSRLEARTAYYFDLLGIRWQYEPEGFALNSGNYLPDFLCNNNFYVEVKPDYSALKFYERKLRELCQVTQKLVFYFPGLPQEPKENDKDKRFDNHSISWCYRDDTEQERERMLDEIRIDYENPDDIPFLICPHTCNTRINCHSYFVWYAFCRKKWGVPYFGDFESGYDEDVHLIKRAKGLKFDRSGRAVL